MTVGRVRESVQALASYQPGKSAKQAEAEHGIEDAIKLASNENPYEPVSAIVDAVQAAASGVNRYADHRATAVRERIALWLGLDATQVAVGCGSVGLLQQLCLTYLDPGDEVVYPWPSFEAYPINVKMMGGVPVTVDLVNHAFDLDAVAAAITPKTKIVMLATPNNPTGTAISTADIAAFMTKVPDDVMVMVDEAYREFTDPAFGDPVADLVPHHRNVVVSRTLSKAYGLAGLRVGYAVADPAVVIELDKVLLAFTVNGLAQAGALAALDSLDQIQPKIDSVLAERRRVVAALTDMGQVLPDAQANFVYIPMGEAAEGVAQGLEERGVVVRPFPGVGIRVTIGTPPENDRFLTTLAEVLA